MNLRRIAKYVLTGLFFLLLGGLWAFSYFFFNPFEGRYEGELSMLIPRDVEFYVAKPGLAGDFDPLPRPLFADEFLASPNGQAILELESVAELLAGIDVEASIATLDENLAQLPVEVDPLEVFGGKDLVIAGYFSGRELADVDWAVYGRANWMGKLGVEAVRKDLPGLDNQGITLADLPEGFTLSGGALQRPLHLTRILDVVVISTRADLIARAHELQQARGEDSFGFSAKYQNHMAEVMPDEDVLDVYVNQRDLLEAQGKPGSWPDPSDESFGLRALARLFQLGVLREYVVTMEFGNGVTIDASGAVSSEHLTPVQKKFYRLRGLEKSEVHEFAKMAPADCGVFVCGRLPMYELLNELVPTIDPALLSNLEDPARDVFGYADIYPLLGDLSTSFGDDFAFFMRNDDYGKDTGANAPPANDTKVTAWAAALRVDDEETLESLREHIRSNPSAFGIQGRNPATGGIFTNEVSGGGVVYEYHSPLVPGTGHLSTLEMFGPNRVKYFLVSNSHKLLGQVFTTYRGQRSPLSKDNWFQTLVNSGLGTSDAVLWFNPRAISQSMNEIALQDAEFDIGLVINWDVERPRIEKKVLKESFPGEKFGAVSPDKLESFEFMVQEEVDAFEREFKVENLPRRRLEYTRPWKALEITSGTLLELSIDPKAIRLHGRIVTPFDVEG